MSITTAITVARATVKAIELAEQYGPLLAAGVRGRRLLGEIVAFVRENREAEGLTAEERGRAYSVLQLDPKDVTL